MEPHSKLFFEYGSAEPYRLIDQMYKSLWTSTSKDQLKNIVTVTHKRWNFLHLHIYLDGTVLLTSMDGVPMSDVVQIADFGTLPEEKWLLWNLDPVKKLPLE